MPPRPDALRLCRGPARTPARSPILRRTARGVSIILFVLGAQVLPGATPTTTPTHPGYEQSDASPDGIGKFYLGREIAQVMGHPGAPWLERPERQEEERPDLLHERLPLRPGMIVADLGAGTGYHSWRLAKRVAPDGRVLAVDIQPEMLTLLATNMSRRGVTNVVGVLGTPLDPGLPPDSVDLVLLVDVYHEFDHPHEMLAAIVRALRPGGKVAFVEFRGEQASVPIKRLHKMTEAQIRREAEIHGLAWTETNRDLPWQHLVFFRKPPPDEAPRPPE